MTHAPAGDPAVADAFAVSRLGGDWGGAFGTLPTGVDTGTIIKRVTPVLPPSWVARAPAVLSGRARVVPSDPVS